MSAHGPPGNQIVFQTFHDVPPSEHAQGWDRLWATSVTPWDRGQPSDALRDLISDRPDLVPPVAQDQKTAALVPGCGRGHDVLLLAELGYDVVGLDLSQEAIDAARENERRVFEEEDKKDGVVRRGEVKWVVGDFFSDEFLQKTGRQSFDLIFDYTVCPFSPPLSPNAISSLRNPRVLLRSPHGPSPQMGRPHV
jgi:methyl halide transferase